MRHRSEYFLQAPHRCVGEFISVEHRMRSTSGMSLHPRGLRPPSWSSIKERETVAEATKCISFLSCFSFFRICTTPEGESYLHICTRGLITASHTHPHTR